jgi:2-polyprenyl-3-methyl-5-hydroxy-6-metoxy-1,4-benzoquinol methylase
MYGMLESAASDIYTQCGLRRVICVSRIHELIVPHLPNKYFTEMGIPIEELDRQVLALSDVHNQGGWRGALYEPQTRASRFRWSKDLYEKPDEALVRAVPPGTRRLLSVGVGAGQAEQLLSKRGVDVHVLAIDPVFAGALRAKGIMAVAGPFSEALERLGPRPFDVVMVADVLHLVPDPVEWLRQLHEKLTPGGLLVVSVPNTGELTCWMKDLRDGRRRLRFPRYESTGVQPVSLRRLRGWCRESHFKYLDATPVVEEPKRRKLGRLAVGPVERLLADKFVLRATRTA